MECFNHSHRRSTKRCHRKAEGLSFDMNHCEVPIAELFINLNSATNIPKDAIRKEKLIQLPLTVQKTILANLNAVSSSITNLASGVDEIVNLVNAIEALNTSMWAASRSRTRYVLSAAFQHVLVL